MRHHKIEIFGVLAIITIGLIFQGCPFKGGDIPDYVREAAKRVGQVVTSKDKRQVTAGGATVHGKTEVSAAQLALVDQGIDQLNAAVIEDGFINKIAHENFIIYTPPYRCTTSPVQRIPSFVVGGGWYFDGSMYDIYNTKGRLKTPYTNEYGLRQEFVKDGLSVTYAAEMLLNYWPIELYVCPDESVLASGVRHGGDHAYLFRFPYTEENRTAPPYDGWHWFNATLYHGGDRNHPLLPRGSRSLFDGIVDKKIESVQPKGFREPSLEEAQLFAKEGIAGIQIAEGVILRPVK